MSADALLSICDIPAASAAWPSWLAQPAASAEPATAWKRNPNMVAQIRKRFIMIVFYHISLP